MAEVRVMLAFKYPPPAGPRSCKLWMLFNPEHLRTINDLSYLIRSRYYPDLRGTLHLYVNDCLMPPMESPRLIRDNDLIRVHLNHYDCEDKDSDGQAHPSNQNGEEDFEDIAAIVPKKRKRKSQHDQIHRSKEKGAPEDTEQQEDAEGSRRKAKKRKKDPEEQAQEKFPKQSSKRKKSKKHSEDPASAKAAKKVQTLPNQEPPTKRVSTSSGPSSPQEPSEITIQPLTAIPLKTPSPITLQLFAAPSVKKRSGTSVKDIATLTVLKPSDTSPQPIIIGKKSLKGPNKPGTINSGKKTKPLAKSMEQMSSSSDSESSSHQESFTKGKKAPKGPNKSGTINSGKKTKPPARNMEQMSSSSDSDSSSDQESSSKGKKSPKEPNKPGTINSEKKTNPPARSAEQMSSSSDSESSPHQESSTKGKKAPKGPNKPGTINSGKKTKPPARSMEQMSSSSDSESSPHQESSTKGKKAPKGPNKPGTINKAAATANVKKTNPNYEPLCPRVRPIIAYPAFSCDQESSTMGEKPSQLPNTINVQESNPNHEPLGEVTPNRDYAASLHDQEMSTAINKSSETTKYPSGPVSGKNECSASKNEDINGSLDAVTTPPLNGTSQKVHKELPTSNSNACVPEPAAPYAPSDVPPCVTHGHETGGIEQEHEPNSALSERGRGQGRAIFPWRGQGGRGFRGRGRAHFPWRGQEDHGFKGRGRAIFPWRGQEDHGFRGRGRDHFPWRGQGRGPGDSNQFMESCDQQPDEPATTAAEISQNLPESPKKDYDSFPLLAAPPQAGKVIAFKILELNENYSPELSDYKEGVVRSYDPVKQMIEMELLSEQKKREPGKFDLVYESEDGKEIVEYAVSPNYKIVEPWSSLITPRLVMEKGSEEEASPRHCD